MTMPGEDRREATHDAYVTGVAAASTLGEGLGRKADRRDVWMIVASTGAIAVVMAVVLSWFSTQQIVDLKAQQTAQQARIDAEQERAREAIRSLQEANAELQRRGQQPVPPPADPASDEALVSAATAKVLASLPTTPVPSADAVAAAVASHLILNPVQVPPAAIAKQVASYLTANPPPPGPPGERGEQGEPGTPGEKGDPGRVPTSEEIMSAFNAAVAQNPDVLCAGKGKFTEVTGFIRVPPENVPQERSFWTCLPQ